MPAPNIQFRSSRIAGARDRIRDDASSAEASEIAARDLDRYYRMLARSLPVFTEPEACLICDALNGTYMDTSTAHLLWAEVEEASQHNWLANKWSVDARSLVDRLRELTPFESLAVVDAVERFWKRAPGEDREISLRAVGLVREDAKA